MLAPPSALAPRIRLLQLYLHLDRGEPGRESYAGREFATRFRGIAGQLSMFVKSKVVS